MHKYIGTVIRQRVNTCLHMTRLKACSNLRTMCQCTIAQRLHSEKLSTGHADYVAMAVQYVYSYTVQLSKNYIVVHTHVPRDLQSVICVAVLSAPSLSLCSSFNSSYTTSQPWDI
jgi:hypothetical protein